MKRALVVSFFFPPINVAGALRPSKFVKYLPEHGWSTRVLTVDRFTTRAATMPLTVGEEAVRRAWYPDVVGAGIRLMRPGGVGSPKPAAPGRPTTADSGLARYRRRLYQMIQQTLPLDVVRMPDRALPWLLPAVSAGLDELGRDRFDAIFSSSGPPTVNLVAALLSRLSGLPWVADFRDLWTQNHAVSRTQPWHGLEQRFERAVLQGASSVMSVSPPLAEQLGRLHNKPAHVVTNGFDDLPPEVVRAHLLERARGPQDRPLQLTFVGTIYPQGQDPSLLFSAIARLRDAGRVTPASLSMRFLGSDRGYLEPLIRRFGVGDLVAVDDPVPHHDALRRQLDSDALIYLNWSDPSAQGIYLLKIFEYLSAKRPVLCIGPVQRVVDELVRSCKVGHSVTTEDEVVAQLEQWLQERAARGRLSYEGIAEQVQRFHYRQLAGQVAEVLDLAVG